MRAFALAGLLVVALAAPSHSQSESPFTGARDMACPAEHRAEMSARLEAIRGEDQAERGGGAPAPGMTERDTARRVEVARIFAEGCFETGRDYHNAALVFQHGPTPEHHYQTWVWATRAVALGDAEAAWLIPRSIDRYLMISGYKQLFATNLSRPFNGSDAGIWCVWPVVAAVDDEQWAAMGVRSLAEQLEVARGMNEGGEGRECAMDLPDPPAGSFPGIW